MVVFTPLSSGTVINDNKSRCQIYEVKNTIQDPIDIRADFTISVQIPSISVQEKTSIIQLIKISNTMTI